MAISPPPRVALLSADEREQRLNKALEAGSDQYDFVIIDCPPSLNMLTLNALVAQSVLITMQCESCAGEPIALMETINSVRQTVNPSLHIEGILRTLYDPRNALTNEVSEQLHQREGLVYRTVIPRNVRLAEAPSHGVPGIVLIGCLEAPRPIWRWPGNSCADRAGQGSQLMAQKRKLNRGLEATPGVRPVEYCAKRMR